MISRDCGVVPVTAGYHLDGGSLTLEAGASLAFHDAAGLYIGRDAPAKLISLGTPTAPVVLTAHGEPTAGAWHGIWLYQHAAQSSLTHTVIEHAGADEAAMLIDATAVTMHEVTIRSAKGAAIMVGHHGRFAAFTANRLVQLGKPAALEISPEALPDLGPGHRFDAGAFIAVRGGDVTTAATWQNLGVPVVVQATIHIASSLTLAAGLDLRFADAAAGLAVGSHGPGTLTATGTAAAPITFSAHDQRKPGGWGNISIHSGGQAHLEHAIFEFGGGVAGQGVVALAGGRLELRDSKFRHNPVGVSATTSSQISAMTGNTFLTTPIAADVPAELLARLGEDNAYDSACEIHSPGGAVVGPTRWLTQGAPVVVHGPVTVTGTLTVEPGTALKFDPNARFTIGGQAPATLRLVGAASAPISLGPTQANQAWPGLDLAAGAHKNTLQYVTLTRVGSPVAIDVAADVDVKLAHVTCEQCTGAVIRWACGAKVTREAVIAGPGTPTLEVPPTGC